MKKQNVSLLWTFVFYLTVSAISVTAKTLYRKNRDVEAIITDGNGGTVENELISMDSEDHSSNYISIMGNDEEEICFKAYRDCSRNANKRKVISLPSSPVLAKNNLIGVVNEATGNYKLSFEIVPRGTTSDWGSVLHFTTGPDCCAFGSRSPAMWLSSDARQLNVHIDDSAKGDQTIATTAVAHNVRTKVTIECNGQKVTVNVGGTVHSAVQPAHRFAGKLFVYAGDPGHPVANVEIYGLEYEILPASKAKADVTIQSETYDLQEEMKNILYSNDDDN